jgi:hypothetical protein
VTTILLQIERVFNYTIAQPFIFPSCGENYLPLCSCMVVAGLNMSTRMSHRRFSTCVQGLYSVKYSRAYAPSMEYILISSLPSLHALLQSFRDPITPSRSTCGFPKAVQSVFCNQIPGTTSIIITTVPKFPILASKYVGAKPYSSPSAAHFVRSFHRFCSFP